MRGGNRASCRGHAGDFVVARFALIESVFRIDGAVACCDGTWPREICIMFDRCRFLLFVACLFASVAAIMPLTAAPAAAQRPTVTRKLNGQEIRLANWTARLVGIRYGDMSGPEAWDSGMAVTIVLKNVSGSPQIPRAFAADLRGLRTYRFDTFWIQEYLPVPPGGEVTLSATRRMTYLQHRGLRSITLREVEKKIGDERYHGPELASVEIPLPPLDPNWVDPDLIRFDGPALPLRNWSARLVGIHYGDVSSSKALSSEFLIVFALKNISPIPRQPARYFGWALNTPDKHSIGHFSFQLREDLVVPPGGEVLVYANDDLRYKEHMAMRSLTLTEHNAAGDIRDRTMIASIDLPLPPPPRR